MALFYCPIPPGSGLWGWGHPICIFLIFPGHLEFCTPLQIPSWSPPLGCTLLHYYPHFTDEESEARGLNSLQWQDWDPDPDVLGSEAHALLITLQWGKDTLGSAQVNQSVTPIGSQLLSSKCLYNDSISPWTSFLQMSFPASVNRPNTSLTNIWTSHFTFWIFFPLQSAQWQAHRPRARFQLSGGCVNILG